jgi:hypothetical protein
MNMQLLSTRCPYCRSDVETTLDQAASPVTCPSCGKPFDVKIPVSAVTAVREVDDVADSQHLASEPHERLLHKVHPVVFRSHPLGAIAVFLLVASAGYGLWLSFADRPAGEGGEQQATTPSMDWLLWGSTAGLIVVLLMFGYWIISSFATTLTVTDSRTLLQQGIIRRNTSEVQHDDVRNIKLDQSIWQRLLGVGKISISSSGQDAMEIVADNLPRPAGIVAMIRDHQTR